MYEYAVFSGQACTCPTYHTTVCIGYAYHRGSSSNYAFWCKRHCTRWRQTTLESSVSLSARTMLVVLSGLQSAATSSSRERRRSSATEHSSSQVLWCATVCQWQSEIPAPCQTSNLLWSLTCLLDYSWGCTNSYDLWRCPWIGFTCYGAIEIIVVLLLLLLLLLMTWLMMIMSLLSLSFVSVSCRCASKCYRLVPMLSVVVTLLMCVLQTGSGIHCSRSHQHHRSHTRSWKVSGWRRRWREGCLLFIAFYYLK